MLEILQPGGYVGFGGTPIDNGSSDEPMPSNYQPVNDAIDDGSDPTVDDSTENRVDILFVVDASGGLMERIRLGEQEGIDTSLLKQVDRILAPLSTDLDYQVGVMLPYGPSAIPELYAHLYQSPEKAEPAILASKKLSRAEIADGLRKKFGFDRPYLDALNFQYNASDEIGRSGHASLYSLYHAMDADKLGESRRSGFFRTDAALVVVFISDENDPCYIQTNENIQKDEVEFRDKYCINPDGSQKITAASVLQKLRSVYGNRSVMVSGIIHSTDEMAAKSWYLTREKRPSAGIGFIEMIDKSGGVLEEFWNVIQDQPTNKVLSRLWAS